MPYPLLTIIMDNDWFFSAGFTLAGQQEAALNVEVGSANLKQIHRFLGANLDIPSTAHVLTLAIRSTQSSDSCSFCGSNRRFLCALTDRITGGHTFQLKSCSGPCLVAFRKQVGNLPNQFPSINKLPNISHYSDLSYLLWAEFKKTVRQMISGSAGQQDPAEIYHRHSLASDDRYPHKCPHCNSKAFLGISAPHCSNKGCRYYKP